MKIPREISVVAHRLKGLRERAVFVGGMIRGLLVTDPAAGPTRATKDVDLVLDVASKAAYADLGQTLRRQGFQVCSDEGAPICRWTVDGILIDIMPIDPAILGFSNVWYAEALAHSTLLDDAGGPIRILDAPRFCATKLEAFSSRGNHDYYHHDLEDVVAVLDGRPTFAAEVRAAPADLREFLASRFTDLLSDPAFVEALAGHLPPDEASQARLPMLTSILYEVATLSTAPTVELLEGEAGTAAALLPAGPGPGSPAGALRHAFVRSSNLRAATYAADSMLLTIEFRSGRIYSYSSVPATVYSGLVDAYSAGRYFHYWIRDRYRVRRLR